MSFEVMASVRKVTGKRELFIMFLILYCVKHLGEVCKVGVFIFLVQLLSGFMGLRFCNNKNISLDRCLRKAWTHFCRLLHLAWCSSSSVSDHRLIIIWPLRSTITAIFGSLLSVQKQTSSRWVGWGGDEGVHGSVGGRRRSSVCLKLLTPFKWNRCERREPTFGDIKSHIIIEPCGGRRCCFKILYVSAAAESLVARLWWKGVKPRLAFFIYINMFCCVMVFTIQEWGQMRGGNCFCTTVHAVVLPRSCFYAYIYFLAYTRAE